MPTRICLLTKLPPTPLQLYYREGTSAFYEYSPSDWTLLGEEDAMELPVVTWADYEPQYSILPQQVSSTAYFVSSYLLSFRKESTAALEDRGRHGDSFITTQRNR